MKNKQIFNDAYSFANQIIQAKIEHFLLEPGAFYGELTQIVSNKIIVGIHRMNIPILQIGTGMKGYITFLLPGPMEQDISWRKFNINERRIGILKGDGQHFAIIPSNFYGLPISIKYNYFNELLKKHDYDEKIYKLILQSEILTLNNEDAFKIQQLLIKLNKAERLDEDLMTHKLPELLLNAIVNIAHQLPNKISTPQQIIFNKILLYIQENLNRKVNTLEICETFKISDRNLRFIFADIIGISPMKYIKIIKLNKTRKDILNSKENLEINLIANKWGFHHSGQFATDYKKLFGEFPSETKLIS